MAFDYAEKMKADASAPRPTLIRELDQELYSISPLLYDRQGRRIPLDRTVTLDLPQPESHHQTHDRDNRAADYMAE